MSTSSHDDAPILEPELMSTETPQGTDRRSFLMRSAMIGAVTVLGGSPPVTAKETADKAASAPAPKINVSPDLEVVKKAKDR